MKKFIADNIDKVYFSIIVAFAVAVAVALCTLLTSKDNNGFRNIAEHGVESYMGINGN